MPIFIKKSFSFGALVTSEYPEFERPVSPNNLVSTTLSLANLTS